VRGSLVRRRVWVILQNVYGKHRDESTVDDQGRFQFHHIWGKNILIVCADSEILMSAPVNVEPNETINYLHINLRTQTIEKALR
jgi:hypothetical protein